MPEVFLSNISISEIYDCKTLNWLIGRRILQRLSKLTDFMKYLKELKITFRPYRLYDIEMMYSPQNQKII